MLSPALHLANRVFGDDAVLYERLYFAAVVGRLTQRTPFAGIRRRLFINTAATLNVSVQVADNPTKDRVLLVYVEDSSALGQRFYSSSQVRGSAEVVQPQVANGDVSTFVLKPQDQLWVATSFPTVLTIASETY